MIAKLRRRHLWMTPVFLGVVPGAVMVAGIAGRPSAPVTADLPAEISGVEELSASEVSLGAIWEGISMKASVRVEAGRAQLIVEITEQLLKPDLLLFWSPGGAKLRAAPESSELDEHANAGVQLPEGSVLVGNFRETERAVYDLPDRAVGTNGRFILYSLPYRRVVSASEPVDLN